SASALTAGQAIAGYPEEQRNNALFLLVVLTGFVLVAFGLLRFGRLVRFVSHAVMTGFLIGVATVLILDRVAPLVGGSPEGDNEVLQFLDLLTQVGQFHLPTVALGLLALGLVFGLTRTPAAPFAALIALVIPALLAALLSMRACRWWRM